MARRPLRACICAVAVAVAVPSAVAAQEGEGGWLALGDSYSSGEGIPGTPAREAEGSGFATLGRDCRRATGEGTDATAWSVGAFRSVQGDLGLSEIALVACTGAVTGEFDDQIGEARARWGRDRWNIVTLSIGGNDIRFAEVLKGCLDLNSFWGAFDLSPGCDTSEADLRGRVDELRRTLGGVYDSVAEVVEPGGDVIVAGYPQLIEEVARWDGWRRNIIGNCEGIQSYDVGMLRNVAGYLNQQIALAAQDADARHRDRGVRFHFLDISADPYEYSDRRADRHALCADDPWLNGQTIGIGSGDWWELDRSFHPHQEGHTNTARVLTSFINEHTTLDDAPAIEAVDANATGLAGVSIGEPAGALVDTLIARLGAPDTDSGYTEIDCLPGEPPRERQLRWEAFIVRLEVEDQTAAARPVLSAWLLDRDLGDIPAGLAVSPPIRFDTTWGDLMGLGATWDDFYSSWERDGLTGTLVGDVPTRDAAIAAFGAGATGLLGC